jgi:hypothetical protein
MAEFLNGLLELDPVAANALFSLRVPPGGLVKHPDLTFRHHDCGLSFGLMGLLNGFLGDDKIVAVATLDGQVVRFMTKAEYELEQG